MNTTMLAIGLILLIFGVTWELTDKMGKRH